MTYMRRLTPRDDLAKQVEFAKSVLEKAPLAPILSWQDVFDLDAAHPYAVSAKKRRKEGTPLPKVGYMLEEFGIIEPRDQIRTRRIRNLMDTFGVDVRDTVDTFAQKLSQLGRSGITIIAYLADLRDLQAWLQATSPSQTLLTITNAQMSLYLDQVARTYKSGKHTTTTLHRLRVFYRYCLREKRVFASPCPAFKLAQAPVKKTICTDPQLRQLFAYIKSPESNPELALLVTLALLFAATTEELMAAQLLVENDRLVIAWRTKKRTFRQRHRVEGRLELPASPPWFLALQKRYYAAWLAHYALIRQTIPRRPLFIAHHHQNNRAVSREWVRKRFLVATTAATGSPIPGYVLRQTAGHLHTNHQDASILTTLGWASQTAFQYVWAPRQTYVPKKKLKRTLES